MKRIVLSTVMLASLTFAGGDVTTMSVTDTDDLKAEIEALKSEVATLKEKQSNSSSEDLEKKIKALDKKINEVRSHDAFDNVKFSLDFRNTLDNINYKYNNYQYDSINWSNTKAKNNALLTSRLLLNMKSAPTDKVSFDGQLAAYSNWGGHLVQEDSSLKGWSASSKSGDTLFRVRKATFLWKDAFLDEKLPYYFSIGRRPATDGFLANHRENMEDPGSPLAHITNMEVDAAMFMLNTEKYLLPGSFIKFIYGRAHTGGIESVYDDAGYKPYAQEEGDLNENVDFFTVLGSAYNNGQYNLMFQNSLILNTKGANVGAITPTNKSLDAGKANLSALSLQVNGVGDEINDFLDETVLFASVAQSKYMPDSGHQLLGSTSDETGQSLWVGATIPDMISEDGRFGVEYNKGSKYWTPMTWAEDSAIGSKLAVRGDAYEAYWNFNLFGAKNLPSQIRYTHAQHDYTPSIRCAGWVTPQAVDIEADDIRLSVSYKY